MIQLRILSGNMAGSLKAVRHFPFHIGRAASNELVMDDSGVWDNHLTLEFQKSEGVILKTAPEAFAAINDQSQSEARLRNGDVISFGSSKIQFWLAPPPQRGLGFRELCVWLLLSGVTTFQIFLVYVLLK